MKKKIILAALLFSIADVATAQDTLVMSGPSSNYMIGPNWFSGCTKIYWDFPGGVPNTAVYYNTKDSLTVYGIAAILTAYPLYATPLEYNSCPYPCSDLSLSKAEAYLRLYKAGMGTLIKYSEDLYVNLESTSVSFYLDYNVDTLLFANTYSYHYYFPVYERYFKTPVSVKDSLYVGVSNTMFSLPVDDTSVYDHPIVKTPYFFSHNYMSDELHIAEQAADSSWSYSSLLPLRYFIFPILTPGENLPDTLNPDTTHVDTTIVDTVGIYDVRMMERYVNLLPNPAAERVTVTSSFGLRSVELYNAAGTKVRELSARGYTTTLDVSDLPEGAYLVRVATLSGPVTKKLIVQRR